MFRQIFSFGRTLVECDLFPFILFYYQASYTEWCIILRRQELREAGIAWRTDREGKHSRQRNKIATFFTHFLPQKSTPLSTLLSTEAFKVTTKICWSVSQWPQCILWEKVAIQRQFFFDLSGMVCRASLMLKICPWWIQWSGRLVSNFLIFR